MPLAVPSLADPVLLLRVPEARDIDAITAACQDPDIPRFTRIPSPYDRSHAELWVARAGGGWEAGTEAAFVIVDARDDRMRADRRRDVLAPAGRPRRALTRGQPRQDWAANMKSIEASVTPPSTKRTCPVT
jgi:RimJ/RimL family protein N-acetyltransferase